MGVTLFEVQAEDASASASASASAGRLTRGEGLRFEYEYEDENEDGKLPNPDPRSPIPDPPSPIPDPHLPDELDARDGGVGVFVVAVDDDGVGHGLDAGVAGAVDDADGDLAGLPVGEGEQGPALGGAAVGVDGDVGAAGARGEAVDL